MAKLQITRESKAFNSLAVNTDNCVVVATWKNGKTYKYKLPQDLFDGFRNSGWSGGFFCSKVRNSERIKTKQL
jgi:hypothetical protein